MRVAEDEAAAILAAAEAQGLTLAQWMRGTAVSASTQFLDQAPEMTAGAAVPSTVAAGSLDNT